MQVPTSNNETDYMQQEKSSTELQAIISLLAMIFVVVFIQVKPAELILLSFFQDKSFLGTQ